MDEIFYIDRGSGERVQEKVYGKSFLTSLYPEGKRSFFAALFLPLLARFPYFSRFYGFLQNRSFSRKKIGSFIEDFSIDQREFLKDPSSFRSFNDFFIRELNEDARPIAADPKTAILPADGRYLVYPDISSVDGFLVKGEKFTVEELLQNGTLAKDYKNASMVIARLAPCDYHRFHFPIDCIPSAPKLLNGTFFSVNPIAVRRNIHILSQNKRTLTSLHTELYGTVLFLEIGATNVASITKTYTPGNSYNKGDEKGYFSFGGSSLILLFPQGSITFDSDLVENTKNGIETYAKMGQSLGTAKS